MSPAARQTYRALATLFFAFGALLNTWLSRLPLIKQHLGLSTGTLSVALLLSPVGVVIALQFLPAAVTRFSSRQVARVSLMVGSCAITAIAFADNVVALGGCLLVLGMALGSLDMSINAQGVALERVIGRPILSGLHAVYSLGALAGAIAGAGAAGAGLGLVVHFAIVGILAVPVWLFCGRDLLGAQTDSSAPGEETQANLSRRLGRYPVILVLGVIAMCSFFTEGAVDNWSGVYLHETLRTSLATAPLAAAAYAIGMVIGRGRGDAAVRRFGRARTMFVAATVAATAALAAAEARAPALAVAMFLLLGAGSGVIVPIAFGLAGNIAGVAPARALSRVTGVGYIGFVAGPPVIGFLAEYVSLRTALGLITPVLAVAALLGLRLRSVVRNLPGEPHRGRRGSRGHP